MKTSHLANIYLSNNKHLRNAYPSWEGWVWASYSFGLT